jgi:tRNA(fMet)-specific endonuclease VapC
MPFLLDTSVCIAAMQNHPVVQSRMSAVSPTECIISTVTTYELLTGVAKCAQPAIERQKVELLLQTVTEMPFDFSAASEAASVRAELEAIGLSIGPYDLLLAGQARANGLTMATANVSEFVRVSGLVVENWLSPGQAP